MLRAALLRTRTLVGALSLGLWAVPAVAGAPPGRCIDISVPKGAIAARDGQWIELTREQWEFMRGIYAMNPETPAGLPLGDKAVLAQVKGNSGGMIFFIDGDKACTPMPIPGELIVMMRDVATDEISHEASGL